MVKTALITGASSGIGRAIAQALAKSNNYRLILCGRRKERLEALQAEFPQVEMYVLTFDVRRYQEVEQSINKLPEKWRDIDILINNAGNAHGLDPIHKGDIADWDAMIDSNIKGILYVSRLITPSMVERKNGHVINIGSIAGKEVYPNGNVYCGSKFAVDAITEGMRKDLYSYGIRVGAIHPGLVETEFSEVRFKGDSEKAEKVYQGYRPLKADDVADTVKYMLEAPAHVNLADIIILPTDQGGSTLVNRKL
jgi:3-hydroxy acid dehydrogenase / malonic semialdehyde reductase